MDSHKCLYFAISVPIWLAVVLYNYRSNSVIPYFSLNVSDLVILLFSLNLYKPRLPYCSIALVKTETEL